MQDKFILPLARTRGRPAYTSVGKLGIFPPQPIANGGGCEFGADSQNATQKCDNAQTNDQVRGGIKLVFLLFW